MRRSDQLTRRSARVRLCAWFGAVISVTLLAYIPSFTAAFQFDDYSHIVGRGETYASLTSLVKFAHSRLIPVATLAVNYHLGGEQPFGYHVVNFAIHALNVLLVYALALALCRTPRLRQTWLADQSLPFAVGAAFLFACHPIQIQAVTYIVQRISSIAALFYIGSVLCYVRAKNAQLTLESGNATRRYAASALLALGAFLSKENTISLPLAILVTEWAFYGGRLTARRAVRLLPFLLLALAIPALWKLTGLATPWLNNPGPSLSEQARGLVRLLAFRAAPGGRLSPIDYFFTQCLVIPRYLRLVFLPWGFNIDHDVSTATGFSAGVAAGLAFLVASLILGIYAVRRWPVVGFGTLWVLVTLSVESSFFPILDVMVEHRMYLAMPGVALIAGAGFARLFRLQRKLALALGGTVVALLCLLTFQRNQVWQTPLALWSDAVAKSPGKARPYTNVGVALERIGKLDEAIASFCKALSIEPKNKRIRAGLDLIADEREDRNLESGEEIVLQGATIGPDGTLELEHPDPCARQPGTSPKTK